MTNCCEGWIVVTCNPEILIYSSNTFFVTQNLQSYFRSEELKIMWPVDSTDAHINIFAMKSRYLAAHIKHSDFDSFTAEVLSWEIWWIFWWLCIHAALLLFSSGSKTSFSERVCFFFAVKIKQNVFVIWLFYWPSFSLKDPKWKHSALRVVLVTHSDLILIINEV